MTEKEFLHWLADEGEGARVHFYDEEGDLVKVYYNQGAFYSELCSNEPYTLRDIVNSIESETEEWKNKYLPKLHKKTITVYGFTTSKPNDDLEGLLGLYTFHPSEKMTDDYKKFEITIREVEE